MHIHVYICTERESTEADTLLILNLYTRPQFAHQCILLTRIRRVHFGLVKKWDNIDKKNYENYSVNFTQNIWNIEDALQNTDASAVVTITLTT